MTASIPANADGNRQRQSPESTVGGPSRDFFKKLLNKLLRVKLTDGRVLVGQFMCTDKDANIILGSCAEYVPNDVTDDVVTPDDEDDLDACMKTSVEPRILGLAMVKGQHIVSMHYDDVATSAT